jgi:hypothetical protein
MNEIVRHERSRRWKEIRGDTDITRMLAEVTERHEQRVRSNEFTCFVCGRVMINDLELTTHHVEQCLESRVAEDEVVDVDGEDVDYGGAQYTENDLVDIPDYGEVVEEGDVVLCALRAKIRQQVHQLYL